MAGKKKIKCFVRLKPHDKFTRQDSKSGASSAMPRIESPNVVMGPSVTKLLASGTDDNNAVREYVSDYVFDPQANQNAVFGKVAKPIMDKVVNGGTGVIMVHGHSGAGKTFAVLGEREEERGIVPRTVDYIFALLEKKKDTGAVISISVFDTVADGVRDLAAPKDKKAMEDEPPVVLEVGDTAASPKLLVPAEGLTSTPTKSSAAFLALLEKAVRNRPSVKLNSTFNMREKDKKPFARSHQGIAISIARQDQRKGESVGHLLILNLASNCAREQSASGKKLLGLEVEAAVSLRTLGDIIQGINHNSNVKSRYNESVLTKILKPYLTQTSCMGSLLVCGDDRQKPDLTTKSLWLAHRCVTGNDPEPTERPPSDARYTKLLTKIQELEEQLQKQKQSYERKLTMFAGPDVLHSDDDDDEALPATMKRATPRAGMESHRQMQQLTSRLKDHETELLRSRAQNDSLQRKLAKKDLVIEKLNRSFKTEQDGFLKNVSGYRKERIVLQDKIEVGHQTLRATEVEFVKDRTRDMAAMRERDNDLIAAQNARVDGLSKSFYLEKGGAKLLHEQKAKFEAQMQRDRVEWSAAKEQEMKNVSDQYEYYLKEKNTALKNFISEYEEYKREKDLQTRSFVAELGLCYDYMQKLTQICQNVDQGFYPLQEKNGVSRFRLSPQDKDTLGSCDEMRLKQLRLRLKKVDKTMLKFQAAHANGWLARITKEVEDMTVEELQKEVLQTRKQGGGGAREQPNQGTLEELDQLRERLLDELSGHSTVQYIKQLEDERDFYKKFAHDETKKMNGLRIAYQSQSRMLTSIGGSRSRPDTAPLGRPSTSPSLGFGAFLGGKI